MQFMRRLMWDNEGWRTTVAGFIAGLVTPFIVQEGILRQEEWSISFLSFALTVLCGAALILVGVGISVIVKPPKKNGSKRDEPVER